MAPVQQQQQSKQTTASKAPTSASASDPKLFEKCKTLVFDVLKIAREKASAVAKTTQIPEKLYTNTMDLANTIASKIRNINDNMVGKADPANVTISNAHFSLLQDLRTKQPEKYKKLVYFGTIYPTIKFQDQKPQLTTFFKSFS
jgi:hypothetical protein